MSTETAPQNRGGAPRHRKAHLGSGPKANAARMNGARNYGRTCACGCGGQVSPLAVYQVGHYRGGGYVERVCIACGATFKIVGTSDRQVCTKNRKCQGTKEWVAELRRLDGVREQRVRETLREIRSSWTAEERRVVAARRRAYARKYWERDEPLRRAERNARLRQIDLTLERNAAEKERQTDDWLFSLSGVDRDIALSLLTEQQRDERKQKIQWEESLDRTYDDGAPIQLRRGTVHFDREDDIWPYVAARSRAGGNYRRTARRRFNAQDESYVAGVGELARRRGLKKYVARDTPKDKP